MSRASLFLSVLLACGSSQRGSREVTFDLQGHRGCRGLAPENTLHGFAQALAIGVTTLEMDVVMTADGVVVVHHDERLNPDIARLHGAFVEGEQPLVASLELEALKRYDVGRVRPGSAYATRFAEQAPRDGESIPMLAEVVELVERIGDRHTRYNIELKLQPEHDGVSRFVAAVLAVVEPVIERATIQSFDLRVVREVGVRARTSCLTAEGETVLRDARSPWLGGLDLRDFAGSVPRLAAAAGCAVWSPAFADLDRDQVAEAHRLGLAVVPWTVNEPDDMARVIDIAVDGLITDYPDRARAVLSARGEALPPRHAGQP